MTKIYHVQTFSGSHQADFFSRYDAKKHKQHLIRVYDFDPEYIEIESFYVTDEELANMNVY